MLWILTRITEGQGHPDDLEMLEELCAMAADFSLCGLGTSAPNPVLTTLRYFRREYEAHIVDGKCPAGVCKALIRYSVVPDRCDGCAACVKPCPVNAVHGKLKKLHEIDPVACIKCGACREACKREAIVRA
jgi:NAD-dependent dihydropyrimidine dehydrogenase PreA subunit